MYVEISDMETITEHVSRHVLGNVACVRHNFDLVMHCFQSLTHLPTLTLNFRCEEDVFSRFCILDARGKVAATLNMAVGKGTEVSKQFSHYYLVCFAVYWGSLESKKLACAHFLHQLYSPCCPLLLLFKDVSQYQNAELIFCNIDNIHVMRTSAQAYADALSASAAQASG